MLPVENPVSVLPRQVSTTADDQLLHATIAKIPGVRVIGIEKRAGRAGKKMKEPAKDALKPTGIAKNGRNRDSVRCINAQGSTAFPSVDYAPDSRVLNCLKKYIGILILSNAKQTLPPLIAIKAMLDCLPNYVNNFARLFCYRQPLLTEALLPVIAMKIPLRSLYPPNRVRIEPSSDRTVFGYK